MQNISVSKIFNIPENYTLEQLKISYIDIMNNLFKSDRTEIEKNLLANQYKHNYEKAKKIYFNKLNMNNKNNFLNQSTYSNTNFNNFEELDYVNKFDRINENSFIFGDRIRRTYNPFSMFDDVFKNFESNQSNIYSYSNSYVSNSNPDGSRTIIEKKSESNNGDKKQSINAFKKIPNGESIPLTQEEMKQLDKFSKLRIIN